MVFMTLKIIVLKKRHFNLAFWLPFVNLSPGLVNYRSHMTIMFSVEGASVENFMFLKKLF